ncbi:hypothetical protein A3863_04520 (plasmid) [Priestia endophytica]|uniref:hypothetical protein n=1 Tax=Priestia endophytica TaxID=135735 RepID=UPI000DCA6259|nr:hypothetical protein [Priestia endophytica]RAS91842.1 hypothetical protein A3863_04520 [Priestia endophytica]
MPFNIIERILVMMELTLQDVLRTNFIIPLYPTTFRETVIPVPPTPGVSDLPPLIYFDLDNRFNATQEQDIKNAIALVLFNWSNHLTQKWNGGLNNGVSDLAACTNTYATQNLRPTWYSGTPISNGRRATDVAMDQFTEMIKDNGFRRSPRARIFATPLPNYVIVFGLTAFYQNRVPLSFIVDPIQLRDPGVGFDLGSMFHAWLHRAGFRDPNTTSYFATECAMCAMRGYQPKFPGIPDEEFYRYFS